uniref:Secreted protein n=1 Tax=Ascaris lumbricoides TaxID=6252 RepID=A0A0M3ICR0_ASCLU
MYEGVNVCVCLCVSTHLSLCSHPRIWYPYTSLCLYVCICVRVYVSVYVYLFRYFSTSRNIKNIIFFQILPIVCAPIEIFFSAFHRSYRSLS